MIMISGAAIPEFVNVWTNFQQKVGLRPIHNEAEYEHVRDIADFLSEEVGDDEEHPLFTMFELAMDLMQAWEKEHVHIPQAEPKDVLRFLLDQHNLKQKDLEDEGIASQSLVSDVLTGRRTISKKLAKSLSQRFHVDVSAFI